MRVFSQILNLSGSVLLNLSELKFVRLIALLNGILFLSTFAKAQDSNVFQFRFRSVLEEHADTYLVEKVNFRKFHERFKPHNTYWGVDENDKPALLTYHFSMQEPIKSGSVNMNLVTADFGKDNKFGSGMSTGSVWCSTDGKDWKKIYSAQKPTMGLLKNHSVHFRLPKEFVGKSDFWLQIRMMASEMKDSTYSVGQFCRNDVTDPNGVTFDLRIRH